MKRILIIILSFLSVLNLKSETHTILVWDGYMQFMPSTINIELGDTIHFLPLDFPLMMHTITSTNIPSGASSFDVIWQAPARMEIYKQVEGKLRIEFLGKTSFLYAGLYCDISSFERHVISDKVVKFI